MPRKRKDTTEPVKENWNKTKKMDDRQQALKTLAFVKNRDAGKEFTAVRKDGKTVVLVLKK